MARRCRNLFSADAAFCASDASDDDDDDDDDDNNNNMFLFLFYRSVATFNSGGVLCSNME
jgi:hypothetical protein